MSEFAEKNSGWALSRIIFLEMVINKYELAAGSSYIPLPKPISQKHAIVNVHNMDHACFFWTVTSFLNPLSKNINLERTSSYPHYSEVLNIKGLDIKMPLSQITKFEKMNNISVNVYALELNHSPKSSSSSSSQFYTVVPARLAKNKLERHVNLLLLQSKYYPQLSVDSGILSGGARGARHPGGRL